MHATGTAELHAAVERAVVDLDRVTAVFDALLRIAEIEAGARRSAFAKLDAAPLVADLAELYTAVAEERGTTLALAAPAPLPVNGDRDLIQQALANLLDNAIKFSPSGGMIHLTAALQGDAVTIIVSDQGPGIPPPPTGAAPPNGSSAARRHGKRPAPASAWRWWMRSLSSMAAPCCWRTPNLACGQCSPCPACRHDCIFMRRTRLRDAFDWLRYQP